MSLPKPDQKLYHLLPVVGILVPVKFKNQCHTRDITCIKVIIAEPSGCCIYRQNLVDITITVVFQDLLFVYYCDFNIFMSSEDLVSEVSLLHEESILPKSFVEFELVYNSHGSVEDAELSCSHISTDSLVFLEGANYDSDFDDEKTIQYYVTHLGIIRLEHGTDSDRYIAAKQALLRAIGAHKELTESDELNPDRDWLLSMFQNLVMKDCVVFRADMTKSILPEKTQIDIESMRPLNAPTGMNTKLDPTKSLGKSIIEMYKNLDNAARSQHLREFACIAEVIDVLVRLYTSYPVEMWQLGRNESGKIQAYTVWGTAHAYSLTDKLESEGFRVTPNIIGDSQNVRFMNPDLRSAIEETPSVALANLLLLCICENIHMTCSGPILSKLLEKISPTQEDITARIIRAHQLYVETCELTEKWSELQSDDEMSMFEPKLSTVTLNLRNLLAELGIDPDEYLENPFTGSDLHAE